MEKQNTTKTDSSVIKVNKNSNTIKNSGKLFAFMMIVPGLIHFIVFYLGVNIGSLSLAFTMPDADTGKQVFTTYQFQKIFMELSRPDTAIFEALANTLKYYAVGLIKMFLSFLIAYFFYKKVYLHKVYKLLFFLPSMIPGMVYISIFKNFIATYGPIDTVLRALFGYELPPLLAQPETATNTILFYVMWSGFGAQMLIFVGAMNRIPEEVMEAARLDGCVGPREFFQIVFPLVWETFATYFLLGIVGIFTCSGPLLYFVGTDTYTKTQTLSYWIFLQVQGGAYNYPSAIGLFFTVLALPLVLVSRWGLNRVETVTY